MARYAILSDVHGNGAALDTVLQQLQTQNVKELWFLGDLVSYGPVPGYCIQRLLDDCDWPVVGIQGNNDWTVSQEQRADPSRFVHDLVAHHGVVIDGQGENRIKATGESQNWTIDTLTPEERERLKDGLQANKVTTKTGAVLVHASPCDAVGREGNYLRVVAEAEEAFMCAQFQVCFFGHTHQPGVFRRMRVERPYANVVHIAYSPVSGNGTLFTLDDRRVLINPGSVGQPRDGDQRAAYAVYDADAQTVEFHRVAYPIEDTLRALREIGDSNPNNKNMVDVMIQRLQEAA